MEVKNYLRISGKKLLRYSESRREMANITDAVLAATLKELIADECCTESSSMKSRRE